MAATLAFEATDTDNGTVSGGSSYTFTLPVSSAAGKERLVAVAGIAARAATANFTTVTVDGQTATRVGTVARGVDGGSDVCAFITFFRAPGTSSTSINVVATVSASDTSFGGYCAVWTLTDADTLLASTNDTATGDHTLNTNTVTGGVAAAAYLAFDLAGGSTIWTGLAEDFDSVKAFSNDFFSGASANIVTGATPRSINADLSGTPSGSSAAICVSFNPATTLDVITVAQATVSLVGKTVSILNREVVAVSTASSLLFVGKNVTVVDLVGVIPVGKGNILFTGQNIAISTTGEQPPIGGGGVTVPPWRDLARKKRRRYRALEEIEKRLDQRIERLTAEARQIVVPRQTGEVVPGQIDVLSQTVGQIDVLSDRQAQINQMLHEAQRRAEKVRQERIELDRLARIASEEADDEEAIAMLMRFL